MQRVAKRRSASRPAFAGSSSLRRPLHRLRFLAELALFLRAARHGGHRLEEIGVAILAAGDSGGRGRQFGAGHSSAHSLARVS